jgi:hypothetical protein
VIDVDDEQTEDGGLFLTCVVSTPPVQSDTKNEREDEDTTPHPSSLQQPYARSYDAHFVPYDPRERIPISIYGVNDQNDVRRGYIAKGPCQLVEHNFPTTKIKGKN